MSSGKGQLPSEDCEVRTVRDEAEVISWEESMKTLTIMSTNRKFNSTDEENADWVSGKGLT